MDVTAGMQAKDMGEVGGFQLPYCSRQNAVQNWLIHTMRKEIT
jgi:hypothetical protein